MANGLGKFIPFTLKNALRRVQFKRNNPSIFLGHGVEIDPHTTSAGINCSFNAYTRISHSEVGRYTYTSRNCNLMNIKLGSFCSLGPGCQIGLGSHPSHYVSTSPIFYSTCGVVNNVSWADRDYHQNFATVTIEDNVWLGADVIVLDGVKIAEGAICAAGSVVTKDVPPYAIVAGAPAKVIKYRFDQETIAKLLEMKLFNRSDDWLRENLSGAVTPQDVLVGFQGLQICEEVGS